MRTQILKTLLLLSILSVFVNTSYSQNKLQLGLSGIAIIYPGIQADGFALYGQIGKEISPSLILGFKPFFGQVRFKGFISQRIQSLGINLFAKLFLFKNEKFNLFLLHSLGGGGLSYQFGSGAEASSFTDDVMFDISAGLGMNVRLVDNMLLEFNVEYLHMRNISDPDNTVNGNTIIPTLGLVFEMDA